MRKNVVVLVLVLLSLLSIFSFNGLADTNLQIPCQQQEQCLSYCELYQWDCSCSPQTNTCIRTSAGEFSSGTSSGTASPSPSPSSSSTSPPVTSTSSPAAVSSSAKVQLVAPATVSPATVPPVISSTDLDALRTQISAVNQKVQQEETTLSQVKQELSTVQSAITSVQNNIFQLQAQQKALEQELRGQLRTVATGLAGLQQDVVSTQDEVTTLEASVEATPSLGTIIWYVLLVIGSLAFAGGVLYLTLKARNPRSTVSQEIIQYITRHIKAGKKFPHIRQQLVQAGWSAEEIQWAYEETTRHNYRKFATQQNTVSPETRSSSEMRPSSRNIGTSRQSSDQSKVIAASVVALFLVLGLFFLIRTAVVGQAIHFQSEEELTFASQDLLKRFVDKNTWYPLLPEGSTICLEVHDLENSVSWVVKKQSPFPEVSSAPHPCTLDVQYDGAVLFSTWNAFNVLARKPSCESFLLQHQQKNVMILPSKYILPTFKLNPFVDATPFCPVLRSCVPEGTLEEICPSGKER